MKPRYGWLVTRVGMAAAMAVGAVQGAGQRQRPAPAPSTMDATTRTAVIDGAIDHMRRAYIFADVAERMAEALRARAAKNEYDAITAPQAFAETLTNHLQEVSHDRHLRIVYNAEGLPQRQGQPTAEDRARALADERRRNFGFDRLGTQDLLSEISCSPQRPRKALRKS
jgi:hypothetical protein